MAMKKIFCFFVIFAILMSAMPISIFGMENNITSAHVDEASLGPSEMSNSTAVGAEIEQLARSLDYDPVKIFYYVRNNVDYEPYLGVMAGPNWTLLQGAGNSFDQALLLSSLLRESRIQTRYVYGKIEVSADDAVKWLRSENITQAANFLASSGISTTRIIDRSGDVASVLKNEHMWVEAKLPSESDWIPLDPSFKLYDYVAGLESPLLNLTSTSNLLNETINTSEYDKTQGWVTSVNGTFAVEKMDEYANDIFNLILSDSELQNRTFTQVFGYWKLQKESHPLNHSLPYKVTSSTRSSVIPEEYYHKARFKLGTIDYSTPTSEIAGKRITIHFVPATEEDGDYIDQAGGIFEVTPDRVNMKPVLFIEGKSVAEGTPLTLGEQITLSTEFYSAHSSYISKRDKILTAGGFYTIVSNFGKVSSRLVEKHLSNLNRTGYMLDTNETVTKEELVGELLYLTGLTYFYESDFLSNVISCPSIRWYRPSPSQVITSLDIGGWIYENGESRLYAGGMSIDFTHETIFAVGTGDREEKAFMLSMGMLGSCLEHEIFELLYNIESVSTMKILELANNRDIRIYTITQENIGNALPALQLPDYVKNQIKNDVNAGQIVVVPEKEIRIKSWNGTGWASIDPETGSGRYMISGGLGEEQKGGTTVDHVTWIPILLEENMEKIKACEIIKDIIDKFINNPLIKVITEFTERNIFDNLRDELVTAKQALMLIGVTKGVAAIGFTMTFLGFPEYGVGLVAVKCIGNSYLPKLGGIIQSEIHSAKPNDMLIIEDGVFIENSHNETTYSNCPGNYWDDYKRTDVDGDGIGDSPYRMDDDMDYYLLMERFKDCNILAPANVGIGDAHYDAGGGMEHEDGTNHT